MNEGAGELSVSKTLFYDGDGKMDLIFVPETGKNAADIVFTYAKKQGRKARVLTGNHRKKAKF